MVESDAITAGKRMKSKFLLLSLLFQWNLGSFVVASL
jgi:hypothetical protein